MFTAKELNDRPLSASDFVGRSAQDETDRHLPRTNPVILSLGDYPVWPIKSVLASSVPRVQAAAGLRGSAPVLSCLNVSRQQ